MLIQLDTGLNADDNTRAKKHGLTKSCSSHLVTLIYCLYWSHGSCYHCGCLSVCETSCLTRAPEACAIAKEEKQVCAQSPWKLYRAGAPYFPEQIDLHMSWHGVHCLMTYWSCHAAWKSLFLHMGKINICWFHVDYCTIWSWPFLAWLWSCLITLLRAAEIPHLHLFSLGFSQSP